MTREDEKYTRRQAALEKERREDAVGTVGAAAGAAQTQANLGVSKANSAQAAASAAQQTADGAYNRATLALDRIAALTFTDVAGFLQWNRLVNINVTSAHIADGSIQGSAIGNKRPIIPDSIGRADINSALNGGNFTNFAFRRMGGNGASEAAAKSDHSHSISMKIMTAANRQIFLELRKKVYEMEPATENEALLKYSILALDHLSFDDEHVTAEERERLIIEDPGYRKQHLEEQKMDYKEGTMYRRKGKYLTEPHPHLVELKQLLEAK